MPSPGVRMPTMRSPGTAPPSGAKRTGASPRRPRMGMAPAPSPAPGALKTTLALAFTPNQPGSPGPIAVCGAFALLAEVGIDRLHHVARIDLAASDRRQRVVDGRTREPRQRRLQLVVATRRVRRARKRVRRSGGRARHIAGARPRASRAGWRRAPCRSPPPPPRPPAAYGRRRG